MTQPLRGRTIMVTRPRAQAATLAGLIAERGGKPVIFPLIKISPAADPGPLQTAIACLERYSLAIFISPNAIDFSLPLIVAERGWPSGLRAVAIGPSSVTRLASYGVEQTLAPVERFDSESVLGLPELQRAAVAGQRVLILRGNGGRELLAETLRERGSEVDCVSCYLRSAPDSALPLKTVWDSGQLDALTISSSEGLRNLVDLLDPPARAQLHTTPVFVPHQRIADLAQTLGLQQVVLTEPADAGIVAALSNHAWLRA